MYINTYTYIHNYIHTLYTGLHTYTTYTLQECMHASIPTYIGTYLPTYVPTNTHTYIHTYIHTYRHVHTYIHKFCLVKGHQKITGLDSYFSRCPQPLPQLWGIGRIVDSISHPLHLPDPLHRFIPPGNLCQGVAVKRHLNATYCEPPLSAAWWRFMRDIDCHCWKVLRSQLVTIGRR